MASKTVKHPVIKVNIKPGPASLAQKKAWKRLCQLLITEVQPDEEANVNARIEDIGAHPIKANKV